MSDSDSDNSSTTSDDFLLSIEEEKQQKDKSLFSLYKRQLKLIDRCKNEETFQKIDFIKKTEAQFIVKQLKLALTVKNLDRVKRSELEVSI